jgi:hypothetical protein
VQHSPHLFGGNVGLLIPAAVYCGLHTSADSFDLLLQEAPCFARLRRERLFLPPVTLKPLQAPSQIGQESLRSANRNSMEPVAPVWESQDFRDRHPSRALARLVILRVRPAFQFCPTIFACPKQLYQRWWLILGGTNLS